MSDSGNNLDTIFPEIQFAQIPSFRVNRSAGRSFVLKNRNVLILEYFRCNRGTIN